MSVVSNHFFLRPLRVPRFFPVCSVYGHASLSKSYVVVVGGSRVTPSEDIVCCQRPRAPSRKSPSCIHALLPTTQSVTSFEVCSLSTAVPWCESGIVDEPLETSVVSLALEECGPWRVFPIPPWVGRVYGGVATSTSMLLTVAPPDSESTASRLLECSCSLQPTITTALAARRRLLVIPITSSAVQETTRALVVEFDLLEFLQQVDNDTSNLRRPVMSWTAVPVPQVPPAAVCRDIAKER